MALLNSSDCKCLWLTLAFSQLSLLVSSMDSAPVHENLSPPQHPDPPSPSGEPHKSCRCTGAASAAPGSPKAVPDPALCSLWDGLGFPQVLFPSFPPQPTAAKDAHLPQRKSGAPGLFQREKIITMRNLAS